MPRATVNIQETIRKDLKTLPEGYVVLRRLTYGQFLQRREMMASMKFSGNQKTQGYEAEMAAAGRKVAEFEFANCIAEHNLEDDDGQLLDFRRSASVHLLDPRIGDEISSYIDEMNQFEAELGNSVNGSVQRS
jgi:hypothetical protein